MTVGNRRSAVVRTELAELLTTQDVAAVLRVSRSRVAQLVRHGHLAALRLGERGDYRFRVGDVERLIAGEACTAPANPDSEKEVTT